MLVTIIKKELLTNITSLRFVLAMSIAVFVVGGFVFTGRYNLEMKEYAEETNKSLEGLNQASKNLSQLANHVQAIQRKPKLTGLFCAGFEKTLPNTFRSDVFSVAIPEVIGDTNFLLSHFVALDWMSILIP